MSSIDDRIVGMKFNNAQFEANAKTSMSTLDKLKASLNFDAAKKGIGDLSTAAKGLDLSSLGGTADGIAGRFNALSVVATGALLNIGAKAVNAGALMLKSLTLDPIMQGFGEYELKMGSIQTILANTSRYGTKLPEVTAALDELNNYADKTIYNFGDMTRNVGLFTNAGIGINDATSMIKGFSNAAAASGTSAEGAAGAAYQLSQALSAGKITLMDWKSLTNVGMGNKNMQDGVLQLATAMGTFKGSGTDATAAAADFNGSLEKGWLKADVMSNYLKIMAGDMDAGAMAALGLSQAQIDGFVASAATAQDAATKVRTWSQLIGTLKESVASSWTDSMWTVIGDFDQATDLFTGINDTLGGVISKIGTARNDMLKGWVALGGRDDLINIGKNIWTSISNIIAPITQAWAKIFPPDGGNALKGFTGGIKTVTDVIVKLTAPLQNLAPIFEIVFGLFKFAMSIVSGLVGYLVNLFAVIGGVGTGSTFALVGGFAALIAQVINFVNTGKYVEKFFSAMQGYQTAVLAPMVDFIGRIVSAFKLLVQGDTQGFFDGIKGSVQAFAPLITLVGTKVQALAAYFKGLALSIQNMGVDMQGPMGTVVSLLKNASGYLVDFSAGIKGVSDILTKGDFAGASKTFGFEEDSKAVGVLFAIRDALTGVKTAGDGVTSSASAMVGQFKGGVSDTGEQVLTIWQQIGVAFSVVKEKLAPTVSVIAGFLSWIGGQVKKVISDLSGQDMLALTNTGLFMAMYISIKKVMDDFSGLFKSATGTFDGINNVFQTLQDHLTAMQNEIKANIILKIAIALALLAASIWLISTIPMPQLVASTLAIGALMKMLTDSVDSMMKAVETADSGKILALGATLVLMGISLLLMAKALSALAELAWEDLARGIVTLGFLLPILTNALDAMGKNTGDTLKAAASMVVLAIALRLMVGAISAFAGLDVKTIGEGMAYIAGTLIALGIAMQFMPSEGQMVKNAVAIGILGLSLRLLVGVIESFAGLDVDTFESGIKRIGLSLLILVIGLQLMTGTLSGAFAMVVASASLLILAKAIVALGAIDMEVVKQALMIVIGAFLLFAGLALLLTPVIPVMIALGIAMGILGLAMLMAGTGMMLFAMAFTALGVAGVAGAAGFTAAMMAILQILPLAAQQLGLAILAFAVVISEGGPQIVAALTTLLLSLIQAIVNVVPPFIEACVVLILGFLSAVERVAPAVINTMVVLIKAVVNAVVNLVPFFVTAGMRLILGLIQGIDNNLGKIITAGTNLIVNFITGIGAAALQIAQAAMTTVVTFVNGLANAIRTNSAAMNKAGMNLADAIVDGIVSGLSAGVRAVVAGARKLVSGIAPAIMKILGINSPSKVATDLLEYFGEGAVNGLHNMGKAVYNAATGMGDNVVQGMNKGLSNATDLSSMDVNVNPTIKPVLDLTDVQAGAKRMNNMLSAQPITVATSSNSAQDIAASTKAAQEAEIVATDVPVGDISYVQNNYSPKEISAADTYRNTKNQLSVQAERLRANAH